MKIVQKFAAVLLVLMMLLCTVSASADAPGTAQYLQL